jgi:hypothetical protein
MSTKSLLLVVFAALLVAVPASAEFYTVTLANGTEFSTRYRPKEASWDENMIMVLTDVGNWIAIEKGDIVSVIADIENAGFGKVIDTHTIAIGWSANDAPMEDPEASLDPMARLFNFLSDQEANRPDYSVPQFVEPGEAGQGGLPVSGLTPPPTGVSNFYGVGDTSFPVQNSGNQPNEPNVIDN